MPLMIRLQTEKSPLTGGLAERNGCESTKSSDEPGDETIRLRRSTGQRLQQAAKNKRLAARSALATLPHLRDDALVDHLVALDIRVDTLLALSLVPLAEVAWADGHIENAEKRAILEAACAAGLEPTSVGGRLLESCLEQRPPAFVRRLWSRYIETVCERLSEAERQHLKQEVLERAQRVAESAGQGMEQGSNVSPEERALLSRLDEAFSKAVTGLSSEPAPISDRKKR